MLLCGHLPLPFLSPLEALGWPRAQPLLEPFLPPGGREWRPVSQPLSPRPAPPTRGLAHAQTETTGEGAVPEAHGCKILARVGAQGWAQPQREVPALEAAILQLHAGLQRQPPAAQASGSHAQHRVALRPRSPRRGRLRVKDWGGSERATR
jgi:hypothetical protein